MTGFEHPDWRSCSNHCVHGLCVQARNIYVGPLSTAKLTSFLKRLSSQTGGMGKQMVSEDDFCDLDAALDYRNESSIVDEVDCGQLAGEEFRQLDSKVNSAEPTEKCSRKRDITCPLLTTVMMARPDSLGISLNEWVNQGNSLSRADVSVAIIHLRRRRMYNKALQVHFPCLKDFHLTGGTIILSKIDFNKKIQLG
ncbi:hypothetical protein HPP92_018351 [Vanilla planifolia]|uniref:Uncharacterized protein n=1 Tax=Vanilla planifolia TaxID=51239 RepID=A0A835Q9R2_VANPL|nr:hypothetical protein HPP92_018351 [Vanilla planifolia]